MDKFSLPDDQEYIRLDSLLKRMGAFTTGGQAKLAIQNGQVTVNGEICTMRGKKLRRGDRTTYNGETFEVY